MSDGDLYQPIQVVIECSKDSTTPPIPCPPSRPLHPINSSSPHLSSMPPPAPIRSTPYSYSGIFVPKPPPQTPIIRPVSSLFPSDTTIERTHTHHHFPPSATAPRLAPPYGEMSSFGVPWHIPKPPPPHHLV